MSDARKAVSVAANAVPSSENAFGVCKPSSNSGSGVKKRRATRDTRMFGVKLAGWLKRLQWILREQGVRFRMLQRRYRACLGQFLVIFSYIHTLFVLKMSPAEVDSCVSDWLETDEPAKFSTKYIVGRLNGILYLYH